MCKSRMNGLRVMFYLFLHVLFTNSELDVKRILVDEQSTTSTRLNQLETLVKQLLHENQELKQELERQKSHVQRIETLQQDNHNILGATYIRWGNRNCPGNDTELIYSGYAGGGHYSESGASADYVCLPPNPDFSKTSGGEYGHIYGAEYDSNFFAPNADSQDVPCALCRSNHVTSTVMIPGKNRCPPGWKSEYYGYLSSGSHDHAAATSFVCMDIKPDYLIAGVDQHYGALFYEVIAKCGSLKCPPYVNNYPLTCVVCSK